MKVSATRCITRLNLERRFSGYPRISNSSTNISKLLGIYNFYKVTQFRMNLRKQIQQRKNHGSNRGDEPPEEKETNKIVIKDGYKFILLDGLYYKLTKKSYSKEEIEQWCAGRKNASSKMKTYHKEKKARREKKEEDQVTKTDAIYNREISKYPKYLRELFT
jgi:hypothetical protein